MFGYCNDPDCIFNISSLVGSSALENRAFSVYAKKSQTLMDAVDLIVEQYEKGNSSFSLDFDDDVSENDLDWIKQQVEKRLS